jgi:hypothetical protein
MRILPSCFNQLLAGLALALLFAATAAAKDPQPSFEDGFVGFHVEPLSIISDGQKADLGVSGNHGVVVAAIVEKGPADLAGLRIGDYLLRFGTREVPDLFTRERGEAHHLWRVAMHFLLETTRPGDRIPVVVRRDGVEKTCMLTPVSAAELHRLQADEAWRKPPALADAGPPAALAVDFQGLAAGTLVPPGFHPFEGRWRVVREGSGTNMVLRQERMIIPWSVLLIAGQGRCYRDATASVRFCPISGVADASGGIIFRAQDPLNYYVVRPNALEDNYRIYIVKDGVRTQLGGIQVTPPKRGTWHVFEITFRGPNFRATLDGENVVEARDETFTSGWCGFWTKADSVTLFDDLKVVPEKAE